MQVQWAGVCFLAVSHRDACRIRAPGLYGFARRCPAGDRVLLYIDQAERIDAEAGPHHPLWVDALNLGMSELHICLKARDRLDRLQLRHHLIKRVGPILNLISSSYREEGGLAGKLSVDEDPQFHAKNRGRLG